MLTVEKLTLTRYGNVNVIDNPMPKNWFLHKDFFGRRITTNNENDTDFLTGFNKHRGIERPIIDLGGHYADYQKTTEMAWQVANKNGQGKTAKQRADHMLHLSIASIRQWIKLFDSSVLTESLNLLSASNSAERIAFWIWLYELKAKPESLDSIKLDHSEANLLHYMHSGAFNLALDYDVISFDRELILRLNKTQLKTALSLIPLKVFEFFDVSKTTEPELTARIVKKRLSVEFSENYVGLIISKYPSIIERAKWNRKENKMLLEAALNQDTSQRVIVNVIRATSNSDFPSCNVHSLNDQGYPISELIYAKSDKQLLRILIGSSHLAERRVFDICRHTDNPIGIFSTLQTVFLNRVKDKLDRHVYLNTLTRLASDGITSVSELTPNVITDVISVLSSYNIELVDLLNSANSADTIRAIHQLLQDERTTTLLHRRLNKWTERKEGFVALHDYSFNAVNRHLEKIERNLLPEFSLEYPEKAEIAGYRIEVAQNVSKLKLFGRKYRHCVGGKHYQERAMFGGDVFISVSPQEETINRLSLNNEAKKGLVCQVSKNGNIRQANGFANRIKLSDFNGEIQQVISKFFKQH